MKRILNLLATMMLGIASAYAATTVSYGTWIATIGDDGYITFKKGSTTVLSNTYAAATYTAGGTSGSINTGGMTPKSPTQVSTSDEFGSCKRVRVVYTDGTVTLTRIITLYDDFFITGVTISANNGAEIRSNHIEALATNTTSTPFSSSAKKMVWVPFDNDDYTEFEPKDFSSNMTSHEVTYVYDSSSNSNNGFVVGSIDHDKWKSGIEITGASKNNLTKLVCLSGFTNMYTRDGSNPHGYVKGSTVESARYFIGIFSDWREGMNAYADANVIVAPRAEWTRGNPMGWNSWGVLAENVSYSSANSTAQWINDNLRSKGFYGKDGSQVISLDSYAEDNITADELRQMGSGNNRGQRLGLYGGLVVWKWNIWENNGAGPNYCQWYMNGTNYNWIDVILKKDGQPIQISKKASNAEYYAIDPTHPGVKQYLQWQFSKWAGYGIKYVKVDFMNAASCEGDSWYDPNITTGIMAYNYGMKMIHDLAEKYDMYVVESIAPIFPYRWAHGRRVSCDAWGDISETEYVMNAITWGWWTDRLYTVNDPDNLVMVGKKTTYTVGKNRARATSGVCTGAFIFGDDGTNSTSQTRLNSYAGNADVNDYVRNNLGSFMPLDYTDLGTSHNSAKYFYKNTGQYCYVAAFNYKTSYSTAQSKTINFSDLGLSASDVGTITELWDHSNVTKTSTGFSASVKYNENAKLYRLTLNGYTDTPASTPAKTTWQYNSGTDFVKGQHGAAMFADFNGDGLMDLYYCGESDLTNGCQPSTFKIPYLWSWQTQSNLYLNNGDGTFQPRLMQYSGTSWTSPASGIEPMVYPRMLAFDYDNDGNLDLLACGNVNGNEATNVKSRLGAVAVESSKDSDGNYHYAFTALYHNNGDGTFTCIGNAGLPAICSDRNNGLGMMYNMLAAGDIDHDGFTDIAISGNDPATNSRFTRIYRNNGNGTFSKLSSPSPSASGNVYLVDLNNDGWLDMALIGEGHQALSGPSDSGNVGVVYINNQGNGFTKAQLQWPDFYSLRGSGCAFADFNEDGYLDLFTIGYGDMNIGYAAYIYLNSGDDTIFNGEHANLVYRGIPLNEGVRIMALDFNGDGHSDVLIEGGTGKQIVYYGDGKMHFTPGDEMHTRDISPNDGRGAVGDITGNGLPDLFNIGYMWTDSDAAVNVMHGSEANYYWGGILWENRGSSASSAPKRRRVPANEIYTPADVEIEQEQIDDNTAKLTVTWEDNNFEDPTLAYNVLLRTPSGKVISTIPVSKTSGAPAISEGKEAAVRPGVQSYSVIVNEAGNYTPGVQALNLSNSYHSDINWADEVTGVEDIAPEQDSRFVVRVEGCSITVRSDVDCEVTVCDLAGRTLAVGRTNMPVVIACSGVVIVRAGEFARKLML